MKNDSDGVDVVVASAFVIDRPANAMPFGGITIWMHESRERERESWFFANIFSVWHPDRLSLESNQDAKIFRAKKSTVCKKKHRASSSLRSDSAAKQQAVNVIGSLHHMSQWSWVFMHRWWIRIIRPLAVTWIGFLSNSSKNMWRECRFFFHPEETCSSLLQPSKCFWTRFSVPSSPQTRCSYYRTTWASVRLRAELWLSPTFPGWVRSVRGIS